MGSKLNPWSNPGTILISKLSTKRHKLCSKTKTTPFSLPTRTSKQPRCELQSCVKFKSLDHCKLGIARYPDFQYDAKGGTGTGTGSASEKESDVPNDQLFVSFDVDTLFVPPLTGSTTKFLGLPLPPFLKIRIDPEIFRGNINRNSGKVELEFRAKFWFSVGSVYKAPPLAVATVLTWEESAGKMRSGRGERLDGEGKCRLVGVATVDPIDDFLMNTFLGLPTECLADLNAIISFSDSS